MKASRLNNKKARMVRSKTRSSWDILKNERSRQNTFRKRKQGLFKKAGELKTLCDVKLCVIIYASKSDGQLLQPEIFPEQDDREVKQIINRYASSPSKKVHALDDFYAEKITELRQQTKKLRQKNDELQYPTCDDRIDALSLDQLHSLAQKLDHKIEALRRSTHQSAIHENIPLHFANMSGSTTVMYNNGSALPESAQGLFYNNLDRRMLEFNHQMLTFEHPSDNGWNRSAGMAPLADCYNDQYAPLTLHVPPNCLDAPFHSHAAPYPMSTSALFPSHFVSSHKLPVSLGLAMQPSLENINASSSSQSPEDLTRLESNICSIHNSIY